MWTVYVSVLDQHSPVSPAFMPAESFIDYGHVYCVSVLYFLANSILHLLQVDVQCMQLRSSYTMNY